MEVVVASYKTATLKFPAIPRLLGLDAFDVSSIIEPFVRADTTMPREVKKHFNALEETIMETLAWSKGSSLFGFMRAAESGYLAARPAAAALAAVSGAADSPGATAPVSPGGDTKVIKRERSFSVAAVGAEAASHDEKSPEASPSNSFGGLGGDKGDHIAAFSTPLKGATTPARPGQAKPRLSMGGADAAPLPKRFVRPGSNTRAVQPSSNSNSTEVGAPADPAVVNSLRVFFAKVMRLSARRLADLCERLSLPPALTQQSYALTEHALYEHTTLLYNRHLDQILLCAVYGACKVNKDNMLKGRTVPFREIIYQYEKQPQCREEVFWTVILTQTDPELEVKQQGDIIEFYNKVFVPEIKAFLLSLKTRSPAVSAGPSPMKSPGAPMSPLPAGLQSPRRMLGGIKQNVYVSPMRSDKALASLAGTFTPRSKSLYAFLGESTHAYQSPARDLSFINRRISSSAAKAAAANAVAGAGGVAAVAGEVAAMPKAVTGGGGMKRDGPPTFDEGLHSPGDGGKPPKAPRLA
jgi:retinoblastoma-like protein 1